MTPVGPADVERVFREEYGRAVSVLVRLLGDIDLAEEAVQEAFVAAVHPLAGGGGAAEPGRLDHHDRPQPGSGQVPAGVDPRAAARRGSTGGCA